VTTCTGVVSMTNTNMSRIPNTSSIKKFGAAYNQQTSYNYVTQQDLHHCRLLHELGQLQPLNKDAAIKQKHIYDKLHV